MNEKIKKYKIPIILSLIIIIISLPVIFPSAFAHKLLSVDPQNTMKQIAEEIPDPSKQSWFTLEVFERQGQSHWYSFIGNEGQDVLIQALVPDLPHSRNFNPSFDLIIGDDKVTAQQVNIAYVEPYSHTNWFVKAELRITLPDYGIYYIRAHDELNHYSVGDIGKFSLGIGEKESLTFIETLSIPVWIMYVNLFFDNLIFVWVSLVLVFILLVVFLVLLTESRRASKS